jgi:hypothetical protein
VHAARPRVHARADQVHPAVGAFRITANQKGYLYVRVCSHPCSRLSCNDIEAFVRATGIHITSTDTYGVLRVVHPAFDPVIIDCQNS